MRKEENPIEAIQADFDKALRPELMEAYSFEYVYRLFLILCSTKRDLIDSCEHGELDQLESTFREGLKTCVARLNHDKGLSMDEEAEAQFASIASTNIMLYIKGGMETNPVTVAKQVSKAMEKKLYTDGVLARNIHVTRVFTERA